MALIRLKDLIINVILLLTIFNITSSCVDEYWPKVLPKYESNLVVEGQINSQQGPYEVTLSLSTEVNRPYFDPLKGCSVTILDDVGNSEQLIEIGQGKYTTTAQGIRGIPGRSYKLKIITPQGKNYESKFTKMPQPGIIDSIYYRPENRPHPDLERMMSGLQFFLNAHNEYDSSNYFYWRVEQTYKFNANYKIRFYYDGQMRRFKSPDSLFTCYKTDHIPNIYLYNTERLEHSTIKDYPLHYVNTESKALSIRYSILVNQYSITKETYKYWNDLASLNDEQGDLYSRLPFQVRGNVFNTEDKDEPVLGCFLVAGKSTKRIFIDRPDYLDFYYTDSCNLYGPDQELLWIHRNEWPIFLPAFPGTGGAAPAWVDYQWCVDCTKSDGKLEKPEFWVE